LKKMSQLDAIKEPDEEDEDADFDSDESYLGPLEDDGYKDAKIAMDEFTQGHILGLVPWGQAGTSSKAGCYKCRLHNPENGWGTMYLEENEVESFAVKKSTRQNAGKRKTRNRRS